MTKEQSDQLKELELELLRVGSKKNKIKKQIARILTAQGNKMPGENKK